MTQNRKILFYLLALLIFSSLIYSPTNLNVTGDMSVYMNQALNISKGYGNTYDRFNSQQWTTLRSPLFPLFIALSFKLFSISLSSAFYVVKVFCILNVLLTFYLGKVLFGEKEGLLASVLMALSPSLGFWSYRHLDSVWVSFVLLSILIYIFYIQKNKNILLFFSGTLIGIAFLVKEVSLFLFIYPILLAIIDKKIRNKQYYISLILYISGILLILFPWATYVFAKTNSLAKLFGSFISAGRIQETVSSQGAGSLRVLELVRGYFGGLLRSPLDIWRRYSPIFPLFGLAWLYTFYKSLKGNLYGKIFLILLLLFSPIVAVTSSYYTRPGQLNFFIIISYLLTGWFLVFLAEKLSTSKLKLNKEIILPIFVGIIFIFDGGFANRDGKTFLRNNLFVRSLLGKSIEHKFSGWYNESPSHFLTKIGIWIKENQEDGVVIMHDLEHYYRPLYFHSEGKAHFVNIPIRSLDEEDKYNIHFKSQNKEEIKTPVYIGIKRDVSMHTWCEIRDGLFTPGWQFYAIMEEDLFKYIEKKNVRYILIWRGELEKYFDQNQSFYKVTAFHTNQLAIYQVIEPFLPTEKKQVIITGEALNYLKKVKDNNPRIYNYFMNKFFCEITGLAEQDLASYWRE